GMPSPEATWLGLKRHVWRAAIALCLVMRLTRTTVLAPVRFGAKGECRGVRLRKEWQGSGTGV
ncbi:MAG: hypothetical protein ACKO96_47265, partial [Flammeovirgaceae bacterium]